MFDPFSHYLTYGATDQQTARDLLEYYDGLLVPGTVAAFQREGTGGFVLSLSATAAAPQYAIDSRFPLFQQILPAPKKSHIALAELLGDTTLVSTRADPAASAFTARRIDHIARQWVEFNHGYQSGASKKFAKYAKRLGEAVTPGQSQGPSQILSLYTIAVDTADPWWKVSQALHDACTRADQTCVRVVAAETGVGLNELLSAIDDTRVAIWVSGLQELTLDANELAAYGAAIAAATQRGQATFALYGGFFHVLLCGVGLTGAAHGIGFGESRTWLELPQSGPPPARYYLRAVHRYVGQDLAYQLYLRDPGLVACSCPECQGRPPISLTYHELMKHSVRARADEIDQWALLDSNAAANRLEQETNAFAGAVRRLNLPTFLNRQATQCYEHIPRWIDALRRIA